MTTATEFEDNVLHADPMLAYVVSIHLLIERYLIRWLRTVLPRPDRILEAYDLRFRGIVALSEALGLIPDDLAVVLNKLNALRNKYSHSLGYVIEETAIADFFASVLAMRPPLVRPTAEPTAANLHMVLAAICGHTKRLADQHAAANAQAG